jgi:hypothetical protein
MQRLPESETNLIDPAGRRSWPGCEDLDARAGHDGEKALP